MGERDSKPTSLSDAIKSFLEASGMRERIEQAEVVPVWARAVGPQIAAVTEPYGVTADRTLLVRVRTHAWMTELSLREPEIIAAIGAILPGVKVERIRWLLWVD